MQQQGRFADDPALIAAKRNYLKAIIQLLVGVQARKTASLPCEAAIRSLGDCTTSADKETMVGV